MNIQLLEKFKYLPDVLIQKIINYTDIVSYRHGKYINRINKNDNRYNLLKKLQDQFLLVEIKFYYV